MNDVHTLEADVELKAKPLARSWYSIHGSRQQQNMLQTDQIYSQEYDISRNCIQAFPNMTQPVVTRLTFIY